MLNLGEDGRQKRFHVGKGKREEYRNVRSGTGGQTKLMSEVAGNRGRILPKCFEVSGIARVFYRRMKPFQCDHPVN